MKSISCKQILSWGVSYDMLYEWNDRLRKIPLDKNLYRFSNEIIALFKPFNHSIDYSPFKFTIRLFPSLLRDESPLITFNVLISIYFIPTLKIKAPTKVMASLISYIKEILSIDDEYIYITRDDKYSAKNIKIAKNLSSITPDVVEKISSFISKVLEFYNTYVNQESNYLYREISNIKLDKNDLINQYLDDLEKANQEGDQDKINSIKRNIDDLNKFGSLRSLLSWGLSEEEMKETNLSSLYKQSWQTEEDFTNEYTNYFGTVVRRNDKGELHSLYSPAEEFSDGNKYWYQNNKQHRLDGPAIEYSNGNKYWYYEGEFYGRSRNGYTQEQFLEDLRNEGKIASVKLSWGEEEDFVKEHRNENGSISRVFRENDKGEYHSLYSPAIEFSDGSKFWYQNGKRHREDGPAIENSSGDKYWYQNGKRHRLDGPAVEYYDGSKSWYYEGERYGNSRNGYTQEQFIEDLRKDGKIASKKLAWGISQEDQIKDMLLESIDWSKVANLIELYYQELLQVDRHASYYDAIDLFLDYNLSSEDPTISYRHLQESYPEIDPVLWNKVFSGLLFQSIHLSSQKLSWGEEDFTQEYKDEYDDLVRRNAKGLLHSLYSPAIEFSEGDKYWYQNGKLHRLDGPAKEHPDGHKEWYYDDNWYGDSRNGYTQEQFIEDLKKDDKIASMKLGWGEEEDFVKEHRNENGSIFRVFRENDKGEYHSLYSPAIEFSDGDKVWLQNGKRHRIDGPAIESSDGYKSWYYEGEWYGNSDQGYTQEQFLEDLKRRGKIASMKQGSDELFICLWAPDDVYTKFPNVDDELHVTLIYRKDITSSPDLSESLLKFIGNICDEVGTVKCKATGIGTFNNDSKSDAVLINIVKGASLYEKLRSLVESIYGKWDIDYGYLPHMTLKYKGTGKVSLKKFKPFSWNVRHIGVRIGEDNYLVNMKTGEYKKTKKILSSLEDSSNTLESILPEDSNSFVNPKEDDDIRRVNNKRYDKITDIYDTSNSEISNRTDNPIIGIASQKLSWGEEDFVREETNMYGVTSRYNKDDQLHSLYSPAIDYNDGDKFWYQNGVKHRLDGPAEDLSGENKAWWYEGIHFGESTDGYSQEQFEKDLRNKGKIASQKLSWGDFHNYIFTETISKSVMPSSIDHSREAQEELLKETLERVIQNNELDVKVNKVTFIREDRSDDGERFMVYRYYQYDISCSTQNLVNLAKAVRSVTGLLPLFNVFTTDITEDGLPFDLEAAFDKYWH